MFLRAKTSLLLAATVLSVATGVASADDRCSGTLCDFYYSNRPTDAAPAAAPASAPAGAAPLTMQGGGLLNYFRSTPAAPAGAQSASAQPAAATSAPPAGQSSPLSNSFFNVGGGGLLNLGRNQNSCSGGTICDALGKSDADTPATAVAAKPGAAPLNAGARAVPAAPPSPETIALANDLRKQRQAQAAAQQAKAQCRVGGDPWRCYR